MKIIKNLLTNIFFNFSFISINNNKKLQKINKHLKTIDEKLCIILPKKFTFHWLVKITTGGVLIYASFSFIYNSFKEDENKSKKKINNNELYKDNDNFIVPENLQNMIKKEYNMLISNSIIYNNIQENIKYKKDLNY